MLVKTRYFGEIELAEDKLITFESGIFGFEGYKRYALLFNSDAEVRPTISWLQCVDEESLALPVMMPTVVVPEYNPIVEDELLKTLGEYTDDTLSVLVTVTVPKEIEKMTVNLKAPIVINTDTMKGCQVVVENNDYEIKFPVFDILTGGKGKEEI